jgi:hypothetical protein
MSRGNAFHSTRFPQQKNRHVHSWPLGHDTDVAGGAMTLQTRSQAAPPLPAQEPRA